VFVFSGGGGLFFVLVFFLFFLLSLSFLIFPLEPLLARVFHYSPVDGSLGLSAPMRASKRVLRDPFSFFFLF